MNTMKFDITSYLRASGLSVVAVLFAGAVTGCGGSGGDQPPVAAPQMFVDADVRVTDITDAPVYDAKVTITSGNLQQRVRTNTNGWAHFARLPVGDGTVAVNATGFKAQSFDITLANGNSNIFHALLHAPREWAIARAIVLGTETVELWNNGSAMRFAVHVAVIDGSSQSIETLTSDNFTLLDIDCGWGGPRECASDADGNATGPGAGRFRPEGGVLEFGLQAPVDRQPYLVGVLAERSTLVTDWDKRARALKTFFKALGGNDSVGLASLQKEAGATTLSVLGPYTNDGSSYLAAINQLSMPAGDTPELYDSLFEWIRQAAAADPGGMPDMSRSVLLMTTYDLSVSQMNELSAFARDLGVRVNNVGGNWGMSELAVRTGGFVSDFNDSRQLPMIFGAMDSLFAGTLSYYRLEFKITGAAGTFVSGGNAKVYMKVHVPTSIPHYGVITTFDVAIP